MDWLRGRLPPSEEIKRLPAARHLTCLSPTRRTSTRTAEVLRARPAGVYQREVARDLAAHQHADGGYGDDLFHLLFRSCRGG